MIDIKLAVIGDIAALLVMAGSASQVIPAIAGILAAIWYGFVIYDRIKYGPELEKRMIWQQRIKRDDTK